MKTNYSLEVMGVFKNNEYIIDHPFFYIFVMDELCRK